MKEDYTVNLQHDEHCKKVSDITDKGGKPYVGLEAPSVKGTFYAAAVKDKPSGFDEINFLDWDAHFIVEGSENAGELFCNTSYEIIEAVGGKDEKANEAIAKKQDFFDKGMSCRDYLEIYSPGKPEYHPIIEALRGLAVRHPLEWDKELFKPERFRHLSDDNFKRLSKKMELLDIWKEGTNKGIKEAVYGVEDKKNSFWFAHPVYFMKHLDDAGLLSKNAERLRQVQDEVTALKILVMGAVGMYPESWINGNAPPGQTYCNQAAYLTIKAVDKNFKKFTGKDGSGFPEPPNSEQYKKDNGGIRPSNYWCDVLEEQSLNSNATGIIRVEAKEAQDLANLGYVVIAAWKNAKAEGSPHFATVRPRGTYTEDNGPVIANVGAFNDKECKASEGFPGKGNKKPTMVEEILYYYNSRQQFNDSPDFLDEIRGYAAK